MQYIYVSVRVLIRPRRNVCGLIQACFIQPSHDCRVTIMCYAVLPLPYAGTILKATVDYIRKMQRDMDRYRAHEVRTKQMEDSMRLLKLRIQVCGGRVQVVVEGAGVWWEGAGGGGRVQVCGGRVQVVVEGTGGGGRVQVVVEGTGGGGRVQVVVEGAGVWSEGAGMYWEGAAGGGRVQVVVGGCR